MSAGRLAVAWSAARHRRGQALALVLLSSLVTASAVLGPLYARSLEHALLHDALDRASVMSTGIVVEQVSDGAFVPSTPALLSRIPEQVRPLLRPPTSIVSGQVTMSMSPRRGGGGVLVTAYAPAAGCARLTLVSGRCPTAETDVLVSAAEARFEGWKVGDRVGFASSPGGQVPDERIRATARIVGTYEQVRDDTYWFGTRLTGRAGTRVVAGLGSTPQVDAPVVAPAFFAKYAPGSTLTVTSALDRPTLGVDDLPAVAAALTAEKARPQGDSGGPTITTALDDVARTVVRGQAQASVLVPLLLGQLALLAAVVLGLAASAAVEQRRPEIALVRLRGHGVRGARRMLLAELGGLVAVGVPLGVVVAGVLDVLVSRVWLPGGGALDVPLGAVVAAVAALLVGVLTVLVAARGPLREPIPSLLRRVPPRRGALAVGLVDAVVVTVAAAGVVTIVTGSVSGPVVLATPALLALAVGLVLAMLLVPVAARLGHVALRRGHVAAGVTALQVARRPGVRRVVAIVTVASALLVFATDAYLAGQRNRAERASLETGAQVVLSTDSKDPRQLRELLKRLDPGSTWVAPVAHLQPGSSDAVATMAVVPRAMARVALPIGAGSGPTVDWPSVLASDLSSAELSGRRVAVQVSDVRIQRVLTGLDPTPSAPDLLPLRLELQDADGGSLSVPLGAVPFRPAGTTTLTAAVPCAPRSCTLVGISIDRAPDETRLLAGDVTVARVAAPGAPPVELGRLTWSSYGTPYSLDRLSVGSPGFSFVTTSKAEPAVARIRFASSGGIVTASTTPAPLPVVVAPATRGATPEVTSVSGFVGTAVTVAEQGRVRVVPGGVTNVALVDYDALAARASRLYASGSLDVLVADPARVGEVTSALARSGISVRERTDRAEVLDAFDRSASAWSLRLALVVGVIALLMGALVLVLVGVTSWRSRSRDLAALRLAGVGGSTLRRVGVAEQVAVIVVAVVVGSACGVAGARLALRLVPFFTTPSEVYVPDVRPAVGAMALSAGVTMVWLVAVGLVLGLWLAGRAVVSRVREQP